MNRMKHSHLSFPRRRESSTSMDSRLRGNDTDPICYSRRAALLLGVASLTACGFQLRGAQSFAFKTIFLSISDASLLGNELRRNIASGTDTKVLNDPKDAQAVLDVIADTREKSVTAVNSSGQVREFQLRLKFAFRLRTLQGKELIPETALQINREVAFNESAVLAKEAEEVLLYRSMQSDMVEQVMRRLASVKSL
jgi:LPS-assembly lipoprotein